MAAVHEIRARAKSRRPSQRNLRPHFVSINDCDRQWILHAHQNLIQRNQSIGGGPIEACFNEEIFADVY
jgi:hypothetical protein